MAINISQKIISYFSNVLFLWALSLIFNIITFLYLFYKIRPGAQSLTLHYNVLGGAEWYGNGFNLYSIPASGLIILIVNFILYKKLKGSESFYAPLCVFVSLCSQLIALGAVVVLGAVN